MNALKRCGAGFSVFGGRGFFGKLIEGDANIAHTAVTGDFEVDGFTRGNLRDGRARATSFEGVYPAATDDATLERMFRCAANTAPSRVVIEDIDRAFPRLASSGLPCKVSSQQLLNCLDGLDSQDGVVVVATANDPTVLDVAILRRPGHFDRVVALPAPDRELRLRYFRKFNPHLEEAALFRVAEDSDGFSFAQLKKAYILAEQKAFERNTPVTWNDLLEGIRVFRGSMAFVSDHKRKVGFVESARQEADINVVAVEGI